MTKEEAQVTLAESFAAIVDICNQTGMIETGKNLAYPAEFLKRSIRMYWPEETIKEEQPI